MVTAAVTQSIAGSTEYPMAEAHPSRVVTDVRRILLIKPSSLGDIIHALPTLSALRRRFVHAHIRWLVKREWAEILVGHPDLTDVIAGDLGWRQWPRLVARLRRDRYDLVLDLQGLFRSGLLARLTGAPIRVGFAGGREGSPRFYSDLVHLPVSEAVPWRLIPMHAVDRNLALAAYIGADVTKPEFRFPDLEEETGRMEKVLTEGGIAPDEPVVAFAPVDRHRLRSWPLERYAEAAQRLTRMGIGKILLLGTAGQRDIVPPFIKKVPSGLIDLVGRTTIRELAVLLRRAHLLVANDSAPLHLAAALGTPVIGLFGPTSVVRAGPYGVHHRALRVELPCSPCEKKTCMHHRPYECLTLVSVDDLVDAAQECLRSATAPSV